MDNTILFVDMLCVPNEEYENRKDEFSDVNEPNNDIFLSKPAYLAMAFDSWFEGETKEPTISYLLGDEEENTMEKFASWLSLGDEKEDRMQLVGWRTKTKIIPSLQLELMRVGYGPVKSLIKKLDRRPFEDYWVIDLRDKAHMGWRIAMERPYGYSLEDIAVFYGFPDKIQFRERDVFISKDTVRPLVNERMSMIRFLYHKLKDW